MIRNVLLASSGSMVAQVISTGAILILSRLYSPEAFGLLGAFTAITMMVTAFACGKYDLAAVVENGNGRSGLMALAGFAVTALIALVCTLVILAVVPFLTGDGVFSRLVPFLWLVPLFVLAFGAQLMLSQLMVRRGIFRTIAAAKVVQAASASGLQIALWGLGTGGLIIGYVAGFVFASVVMVRSVVHARFYLRARWRRVLTAAHDRFRFVLSASATGGLNVAAIQAPLILCALFFTVVDTGYFTLSQRVLGLPASLIGLSVSQAFLHSLRNTTDPQARRDAAVSVYSIVLIAGVAPAVFLMTYGPALFSVVFGTQWEESGWISAAMAPFMVSILLTTPFTNVFYVLGKVQIALYHMAVAMVVRIFAFAIPAWLGYSFESAVIALAVCSFLTNFVLFIHGLHLLGCSVWAFLMRFGVAGFWAVLLLLPGLAVHACQGLNQIVYTGAMIASGVAVVVYVGLNARQMVRER